MKESQIQSAIIKKLTAAGWYVVKLIQTNKNGIPDLVCHRDGKTVYLEIKQPGNDLEPLQWHRIKQLRKYGILAYCVDCVRDLGFLEMIDNENIF
jgi:Holliday junction resolvase